MIIVLSPAKRLDFESPLPTALHSQPRLLDQSALLIERLRELAPADIASLMSLSDPLAALNHARYADWQPPFTPANARPAAFAFAGDVYAGLDAGSLDAAAIAWLQARVRILSGLYGLLRPLDLMQAYRLEMGTRLGNARGKDLYAFWDERISALLAADLEAERAEIVVNLASEEYFKSLRPRRLGARVLQPVFEDWQNGRWRVVSFFAKRARGLMARYAATRGLREVEALQGFDSDGYAFAPAASDDAVWVFRRRRD